MQLPEERTAAVRLLYVKKPSRSRAVMLVLSEWKSYRLFKKGGHLERALELCAEISERFRLSVDILILSTFLQAEAGLTAKAEEAIAMLKRSKTFYKSSDPFVYCAYLFLEAYSEIARRNAKKAEKHLNNLISFAEETKSTEAVIMAAGLELSLGKLQAAYRHIYSVFASGNRSGFAYIVLYEYLLAEPTGEACDSSLIILLCRWALPKRADLGPLLEKYKRMLSEDKRFIRLAGTDIYKYCEADWLLSRICAEFIAEGDCSKKAFEYYKAAEYRQIELNNLYYYLIRSAYLSDTENVSRYSVEQFIKQGRSDKQLDTFVNHMIITNKSNSGLLNLFERKIVEFGIKNFPDNSRDRYFNSIYKLISESGARLDVDKAVIEEARKRLSESLFVYNISVDNPSAKSIWIYEKELKEMKAFPIIDGKASVVACDDDFNYYLMSERQKSIVSGNIRARKKIQNADIALYKSYLKSDISRTELLIVLSKFAVNHEQPGEEWIPVLERTLKDPKISLRFKMRVNACLGSIYAGSADYARAVAYFDAADENYLDENQTERMLLAYVSAEQYKKAVRLLIKKASVLSEKGIFFSVKRVLEHSRDYGKELAPVMFGIVINGWYDKLLAEQILKHYNGSQGDWQRLSETFDELSVSEPGLDEIILRNTIWMHKPDKGSQGVFVRMYERDPGNELISVFAKYCSYECIRNGFRPEYETVDIMEKLYSDTKDSVIAFGLSHVYLGHGVVTLNSDKILRLALAVSIERSILFPIFKLCKDKNDATPYIEKNQPFMFISRPDMKVKLSYRFDDSADYSVRNAVYFGFGIFLVHIPNFYGEKISYFFSEETARGSISTQESTIENKSAVLRENSEDPFFAINNALIYEQLFKYEKVEQIITERLKQKQTIMSRLL